MEINEEEILEKAKVWFKESIAENHIKNTKKLENADEFNINPFLAVYLANFLTGNSNPESIAKILTYPRVLGTSITTSFGTNMQKFTSEVLGAFGSTTSGIDIEFEDKIDGGKKYCQLKAGPNTINKDDIETIAGHFSGVIRLAKANGTKISYDDMVVGVIYGDQKSLSGHYRRITDDYHYPVYTGTEFWRRLTGDPDFYHKLINAVGSVAIDSDYSQELENVIKILAKTDSVKDLSQ